MLKTYQRREVQKLMRRWLAVILCLLLYAPPALGAASLRTCTSRQELEAWIDFGLEDEDDGIPSPKAVQAGRIRHIAQDDIHDPSFIGFYWMGGEIGSALDLTQRTDALGEPYRYACTNMCTRAVYAMALSYLGVDCAPGAMSALLAKRSLDEPYDQVTALLPNIERVTFKQYIFDQMYEKYETDETYSPVYLYCRKPNGATHALLLVARTEKNNGFWAVDPAGHRVRGEVVHIFRIRLNPVKRTILHASFPEYEDCTVVGFCQWRRTDAPGS